MRSRCILNCPRQSNTRSNSTQSFMSRRSLFALSHSVKNRPNSIQSIEIFNCERHTVDRCTTCRYSLSGAINCLLPLRINYRQHFCHSNTCFRHNRPERVEPVSTVNFDWIRFKGFREIWVSRLVPHFTTIHRTINVSDIDVCQQSPLDFPEFSNFQTQSTLTTLSICQFAFPATRWLTESLPLIALRQTWVFTIQTINHCTKSDSHSARSSLSSYSQIFSSKRNSLPYQESWIGNWPLPSLEPLQCRSSTGIRLFTNTWEITQ